MSTNIVERNMDNTTQSPSLEEALQRGREAAGKGEREEANRIFRETVEVYPNSPDVWVWLGGTSADLDEAEIAFEQAYALDPNNEKAELGLRWVQLKRGVSPDAISSPVSGAPVPAPEHPDWEQMAPAEPEPAIQAVPAVPAPAQPEQGRETVAAQPSSLPAPSRSTGLSTMSIVVVVLIVIILLGVLGYLLFMR